MTVSYSLDVSSTSLQGFLRLQFRWKGSIWKSILKELTIFTTVFAIITAVYRTDLFLTPEQRLFWDNVTAIFDSKMDYIPLTFMLGFFVSVIVGRWNEIFNNVGWIDNTALVMSTYLRGSDERSRLIRRNVIRYMVLTQVLLLRDISLKIRRRFPTLETVVAAGFMTEPELEKYVQCGQEYSKYFLPIQWSFSLLFEARTSSKLSCDLMLNEIIKHITDFRKGLAQLSNFDWVPIPLVYPQVVFLAVRSYFMLCLIARQSVLIDGEKPSDDSIVYPLIPFFMTALQFIFYVGWMKVAESLMNPLGEDDDDFELEFLIDRNLKVGFSIVDDSYNDPPTQTKDRWWSTDTRVEPLYSADTADKQVNPQIGSAVAAKQAESEEILMMPHVNEDNNDMYSMMDDREALLQSRTVSVISVNRQCGSRSSLASRKHGVLDTIKKQFSRDARKVSRPNRLSQMGSSQMDLYDGKPTIEVTNEGEFDIIDALAEESQRNSAYLNPDDLSPTSPASTARKSPVGEFLNSIPEDEENQRTMRQADLEKLKNLSQQQEK